MIEITPETRLNEATSPRAPSRRAAIAGNIGAIFLGGVLLVAAWGKTTDLMAFSQQVHTEGLDFLFSAKAVAVAALALEAGLGMMLLLGIRRLWVLIPAALLAAFFVFLTGRNFWLVSKGLRDPAASCGCFGSLVHRTPGQALWQDLALLVPALALSFAGRGFGASPLPKWRLLAALSAAVLLPAYSLHISDLRMIDITTQAVPGNLSGFQETRDYLLFVDGKQEPQAKIYISDVSVALLIVSPALPSIVVVKPNTSEVATVDGSAMVPRAGGGIDLRSRAQLKPEGKFEIIGDAMTFQAGSHQIRLQNRPRG
ncbi:MAG TPA: MauE/DoxX family redox-associated membrane protein [Acidobacteriota bacterium]|jgi:uncharacterized membrane protein YphA (DoxX/SURF4 family)